MHKMPIVFLWLQTGNEFGRGIARGIAEYSRLRGPWSFFRMPPYYRKYSEKKIFLPGKHNLPIDGIIAYVDSLEQAKYIKELGLPAIAIYVIEPIKGLINVVTDGESIGRIGAEHLLERGFKNFAYCGYDDIFWSLSRGESFSKSLSAAGFSVNFYHQPKSHSSRVWELERNFLSKWLESLPKPIGLMGCNDNRAQDVTEACKISGIQIPEQISVLGVDDDYTICELSDPPLSSIPLNTISAGYQAAELLGKLMKGRKVSQEQITIYPQPIITRRSTDTMAIDNKDVALAMNFIHRNSKRLIQVSDVAEATGVSLRVLQSEFHKVLGRKICDEIKSARTRQIARILINTDMPISQVAKEFGYSSFANIARYFKKQMGMTLVQYRKKYGRSTYI